MGLLTTEIIPSGVQDFTQKTTEVFTPYVAEQKVDLNASIVLRDSEKNVVYTTAPGFIEAKDIGLSDTLKRMLEPYIDEFLFGVYDQNNVQLNQSKLIFRESAHSWIMSDNGQELMYLQNPSTVLSKMFSRYEFQTFLRSLLPSLLVSVLQEKYDDSGISKREIELELVRLVDVFLDALSRDFSNKQDRVITSKDRLPSNLEVAVKLFVAISHHASQQNTLFFQEDPFSKNEQAHTNATNAAFGLQRSVVLADTLAYSSVKDIISRIELIKRFFAEYDSLVHVDRSLAKLLDIKDINHFPFDEYFLDYPIALFQLLTRLFKEKSGVITPFFSILLSQKGSTIDILSGQKALWGRKKPYSTTMTLQTKRFLKNKRKLKIQIKPSNANDSHPLELRVSVSEFLFTNDRNEPVKLPITQVACEFHNRFLTLFRKEVAGLQERVQSQDARSKLSDFKLFETEHQLACFVLGQLSRQFPFLNELQLPSAYQEQFLLGKKHNQTDFDRDRQ